MTARGRYFPHNIAMHCGFPLSVFPHKVMADTQGERNFCMALGVKEGARYRERQGWEALVPGNP